MAKILNFRTIALSIISLVAFSQSALYAQTENTFSTPKAGDFAFGINAIPLVNFLGNTLNGTSNQSLDGIGGSPISTNSTTIIPDLSITGRYLFSREVALRVNMGVIVDNSYDTAYTTDDLAAVNNGLSEAKVIDSRSTVNSGGSLAVGLEYRIGSGRIQGVFSGSALYIYSAETTSYSYGNAITSINQDPSNGGLDLSTISPSASYLSSPRTLYDRGGVTHSGGLIATAGVEWFVANRVSLGVETNLIALYSHTRQSYTDFEAYNTSTESVETYTETTAPSSGALYVGTGNYGANLTLNFYF